MAEKPKLCRFRADKSAQRILAESIARELGPLGIHVAYVLIDAAIDTPTMSPRRRTISFIKPSAIADELWHLDRSAARYGRSSPNCGRSEKSGESNEAPFRR